MTSEARNISIEGTRFGAVHVREDRIITVRGGILGFAAASRFALLEHSRPGPIAWWQCLDIPTFSFPVIDASQFFPQYPNPSAAELAAMHDLATHDLATVLVTIVRPGGEATVNTLAPLILDMSTRTAVQVVLDPAKYSTAVRVHAPLEAPKKPALMSETR